VAKMAWKAVDGTVKDVRSSTHFGKGGLCAVSFVYKVDGHAYRGEFDVATGRPYAITPRSRKRTILIRLDCGPRCTL
jgi:hypothetical protein